MAMGGVLVFGCAGLVRIAYCLITQHAFESFFAYLDDSGLDHILQLLLGLIPYHQTLAVRIGRYLGVAELDVFLPNPIGIS